MDKYNKSKTESSECTVHTCWIFVNLDTITIRNKIISLSEYPFLNYFVQRSWAEHDLRVADKWQAACKSLHANNHRERKLKEKALNEVNNYVADIKEEINKLRAGHSENWKENAEKLTKHFFQRDKKWVWIGWLIWMNSKKNPFFFRVFLVLKVKWINSRLQTTHHTVFVFFIAHSWVNKSTHRSANAKTTVNSTNKCHFCVSHNSSLWKSFHFVYWQNGFMRPLGMSWAQHEHNSVWIGYS